ncbi:hypothetical protein WA158_000227 [Blastocystis sp. Blastoise]
MRPIILLFIIAIALSQTSCGNSPDFNYRLVTIEVTGNLVNNPSNSESVSFEALYYDISTSSATSYVDICGKPVSDADNFVTGNCPSSFTYKVSQIKAGTAKTSLCIVSETVQDQAVYTYQLSIRESSVRGFCIKVSDASTNHYYSGVCYQTSSVNTQAFSVSEVETINIYTPRINRITDTIYVDAFTPTEIRPEIALILNTDNTIDATTPGNYLTSLTFQGETILGLQFMNSDFIFSGKVQVNKFDTTASFTIRTGPEDTPKKIVNIQKFDCSTIGEYPVLITRVHSGNANKEAFSLKNSKGILIGDTDNINDESSTGWGHILQNNGRDNKGLVAEYAVCLPKDDYTLYMYTLSYANNVRLANSWTSDSYVTFSTLSEQRDGDIKYTGYIVGDFAFTTSARSTSNIITIHLGPVECANNQRVVVFDKLATTNGGTEGFEIFKRDDITEEYSSTAITEYYGLANFLGGRFDPYFRVFLCLDESTYLIRLRNKQRGTNKCTAWSTEYSVEQIDYTTLDGNKAESQTHPSIFKASILSSNTYYGGEFQLDTSIEGEYYSVLNNPKDNEDHMNDIKSTTDCYFDFELFVSRSVSFDIYGSTNILTEGQVITKYVDDETKLSIQCTQENDACVGITGYTITCATSFNFVSLIDCSTYGISIPNTIIDLTNVGLVGNYKSVGPTLFYIKVTPIVAQANKYIIVTKTVGINLLDRVPCDEDHCEQDGNAIESECLPPNLYVHIERQYNFIARNEEIFIYKGSFDVKGNVTKRISGIGKSNKKIDLYYCFAPGVYTIDFYGLNTDVVEKSWIRIYVNHVKVLYEIVTNIAHVVWKLNLNYVISHSNVWKYSDIPQNNLDWTLNAINNNKWMSYYPGIFPHTPVGTARYYVTSFRNLDCSTNYPFFEFAIYSKEGFIAYINGKEVYRFNMEDTTTTAATDTALSNGYDDYFRVVRHSAQYFFQSYQTIILAVEVHPIKGGTAHSDTFNAYFAMRTYHDIKSATQDGFITSIPDTSADDNDNKLFDNNLYSIWESKSFNGENSITYTFNNGRAEWINQYSISCGYDFGKNPKDFKLEGSVDGIHWDLLNIQTYIYFNITLEVQNFGLYSNTRAYNQYKFTIQSIRDPSMNAVEIGEIGYYTVPKNVYTKLRYEKSDYIFSTIDRIVVIRPNTYTYMNYRLESEIPDGFTFNSVDGVIIGNSNKRFDPMTVTISAVNKVTNIRESVSIRMRATGCNLEDEVLIRIVQTVYGYNYYNEIWELYDLEDNLIMSGRGRRVPYSNIAISQFCAKNMEYKIKFVTINGISWHPSSTIEIIAIHDHDHSHGEDIIYTGHSHTGSTKTVQVQIGYTLPYSSISTISRIDGVIPHYWYKPTYIYTDIDWNINYGMYPRPSIYSKISLTRRKIYISSIISSITFEIRLIIRGGSVVYWNGEEIYRNYLPSGTITSSTVTTYTSLNYITIYIRIPIWQVIIGDNVLAFINVLPDEVTYPTSYDNDCAGLLVHESVAITTIRDIIITVSHTDEGYKVIYLNDGLPDTIWVSTHIGVTEATDYIYLKYNNNTANFVNKYCIVITTLAITSAPIEWTFYGCDSNNDNCAILDIEYNINWKYKSERRCFYTVPHTISYSSYKIFLTKSGSTGTYVQYALADIELLSDDYTNIIIHSLTYYEKILYFYRSIYVTSITPSTGYRHFYIHSGYTLPNGLYIDSSSGVIYGTPTEIMIKPLTIVVDADSIKGDVSSSTIEIYTTECTLPNVFINIEIDHSKDNKGSEMSFELISSDGITIIGSHSDFPDYTNLTYSYCIPKGIHYIKLYDTSNDGWDNTYIQVTLRDHTVITRETLLIGQSPRQTIIDTTYIIISLYSEWIFINSISITLPVDHSWTSIDYHPIGWSTGNKDTFGTLQGITQYYRNVFEIEYISIQAGIQYTITLNSGCIIYLNGIEIHRIYMPIGTINNSTLSTYTNTETFTTGGSISIQFNNMNLRNGSNIIAIEIHKTSISTIENVFSFVSSILPDNHYRIFDGIATAFQYDSEIESPSHCFDNDNNTKWYSSEPIVTNWISYQYYNDRREYITSYTITTANIKNDRHPSGWNIEGSNDNGITWEIIQKKSNIYFTSFSQTISFDMIPSKSYNKYRLYFTQGLNSPILDSQIDSGTQLAEIRFYLKTLIGTCNTTNEGLGPFLNGEQFTRKCPLYYTGITKSLCNNTIIEDDNSDCILNPVTTISYSETTYIIEIRKYFIIKPIVDSILITFTITPSLPEGLTLDPNTGIISGTLISFTESIQYTITATNTQSVSTVIQLSTLVTICIAEGKWPETSIGSTAHAICPIGFGSHATRYCNEQGKWEDILNDDECTTVVCKREEVDNIIYDDTSINFHSMPKCNNEDMFGYNDRRCNDIDIYSASWGDINRQMCFHKSEISNGEIRIEMSINLVDVDYIEDPFELCFYGVRSVILIFPYLLSSLLVATNVKQISPLQSSSQYDIYIGTNHNGYNSHIQNYLINNKHTMLEIIKINSNNKFPSNITMNNSNFNSQTYGDAICPPNSYVSEELNLYEYSPMDCEGSNTLYPLYECQQNKFKFENKFINYMKCPPRSTLYISYNLIIEGVNTQRIRDSDYIYMYRAILHSSNIIIKNMYLTRYDNINENNDSSIYFIIQTIDSSTIYEDASNLQILDNTQMNLFMNNLSPSLRNNIKSIQIKTDVINNNTSDRKLRGF